VVLPRSSIFRLRKKSLLRGTLLSLTAFALSLRLEGFPGVKDLHASPWQILAVPIAIWGMVETARCLSHRWSLYHAGVLILLYSELMILATAMFFWLYQP
jgi:CO dehydrogenase/acetyl-CoA synthase gamma subunit (corrinoid Fe-S protein)